MAGWTVEQLADLVVSTQKDLGELKWTNLAFEYTDYPGWSQIFKKEKVTVEGGTAINFNVQLNNNGQAKTTNLYAEDDYNVTDSLTTGSVPWKHITTNYVLERRRMNMNRSKRKLLDEVKLERNRAMGSLIELCEEIMWKEPVSGSDEFYGIPYWIAKYASTQTTPGFYGQNPNGFSAVAGLDTSSSTYARYRNYSGQYTLVTKADLIKKMKTMARKTDFKSPIANPNYDRGAMRRAYYTNLTIIEQMEDLAEAQNDKLGFDMDPAGGMVRFQRHPVIYVPYGDSNWTGSPVYQIDWSKIGVKFLSGEELVETTRKAAKSHTCVTTDIDATLNTWCADRRPLGVLSTVDVTGA